jgi:hypothetical protein
MERILLSGLGILEDSTSVLAVSSLMRAPDTYAMKLVQAVQHYLRRLLVYSTKTNALVLAVASLKPGTYACVVKVGYSF